MIKLQNYRNSLKYQTLSKTLVGIESGSQEYKSDALPEGPKNFLIIPSFIHWSFFDFES